VVQNSAGKSYQPPDLSFLNLNALAKELTGYSPSAHDDKP